MADLRSSIARPFPRRQAEAQAAPGDTPWPETARETLAAAAALIESHSRTDAKTTATVIDAARRTAAPLAESSISETAARTACEAFAGSALAGMFAAADGAIEDPALLVAHLEERTGLSALGIGIHAVSDPALLVLPLDAAIDAALALFSAVAPVRKASLWLADPQREPRLLSPGWDADPQQTLTLAQRAMALDAAVEERGLGVATVRCWQRPAAAIVFLPDTGREAECLALAERAALVLGPAFERASLIEGNVSRTNALVQATERRLTRLGFDLHDGPLQDVALLSGELASLRQRVATTHLDAEQRDTLVGRLDDLAAIVSFLDTDVRDLIASMESSTVLRTSFTEALDTAIRAFNVRSSIEPIVHVTGDPDAISDSQRIALLRIVQEALNNVREHSQATEVTISVQARSTHVEAAIMDNGRGFDVERALLESARRGRMGLLGMIERVRLLGGACDIHSRPGGPTTISLTIARWVPSAGEAPTHLPIAATA